MTRTSATSMHAHRWAPAAHSVFDFSPAPAHHLVNARLSRRAFDTVVSTGAPPMVPARALLIPDPALARLCRAVQRQGARVLRHAREYDGMVCAQTTRRGRVAMVRQLHELWGYSPEDDGLQLYLRHTVGVAEPLDVALPSPARLAELHTRFENLTFIEDPDEVGPDREFFAGPSTLVEVDGARFEIETFAPLLERCREWDAAGAEVFLTLPAVREARDALIGWPAAEVRRVSNTQLTVFSRRACR